MKTYFTIFTFLLIVLFSPRTNAQSWEELKSLTSPNAIPAMAAVGDKIYLVSGNQGNATNTWEFNPATNEWTKKASLPQGGVFATAVAFDGKIYVMGGGQNNAKKDYHYIYNPSEDKWTEGAKLLTPRMYHSAAAVNGKIYIIGGQNGDGTTEWFFDEYSPNSNSWTRKAQSPHKDAWYSAAAGVGNKFYRIAGGRYNVPTDYFDIYDTETGTWQVHENFTVGLHSPAAVNYKGKIVIMGGYTNLGKTAMITMYDPVTDNSSVSSVYLPEAMAYHRAAVIGDYIYVYSSTEDTPPTGRLWRINLSTLSALEQSGDTEQSLVFYPNPTSGKFKISLNEFGSLPVDITIINIIGEQVFSCKNYLNDDGTLPLSLEGAAQGIYFIHVNCNGKSYCRSVVVY
ncbi:MAG: hypothetical protein HW421_3899 [Ignavibacteria bacterium]|nr:hypothetical protein [Ignavibacteria bacterium]